MVTNMLQATQAIEEKYTNSFCGTLKGISQVEGAVQALTLY